MYENWVVVAVGAVVVVVLAGMLMFVASFLLLLLVGTSNVPPRHFYNDFSLYVRNFHSTQLQF